MSFQSVSESDYCVFPNIRRDDALKTVRNRIDPLSIATIYEQDLEGFAEQEQSFACLCARCICATATFCKGYNDMSNINAVLSNKPVAWNADVTKFTISYEEENAMAYYVKPRSCCTMIDVGSWFWLPFFVACGLTGFPAIGELLHKMCCGCMRIRNCFLTSHFCSPKMYAFDKEKKRIGHSEFYYTGTCCCLTPTLDVFDQDSQLVYTAYPSAIWNTSAQFYIRDPKMSSILCSVGNDDAYFKKTPILTQCCKDSTSLDDYDVVFPAHASPVTKANLVGASLLLRKVYTDLPNCEMGCLVV